jgi:hypothetical protein
MRVRFATTAVLAMASCSRTAAAAALEGTAGGGTCARPASFPSAVSSAVQQQLSGVIPSEVPPHMKISFDKKSLDGKVRVSFILCNGK